MKGRKKVSRKKVARKKIARKKVTPSNPTLLDQEYKRVKAMFKEAGVRYVGYIPKEIPPGRVLMHANVAFAGDHTRIGDQGFRAFITATKPLDKFVPYPCGWSGLPHYANARIVAAWRRKKRGRTTRTA